MRYPYSEPERHRSLYGHTFEMYVAQPTELICSKCNQKCTTWGIVDGKVVGACCLGKQQQQRPGPSEHKRDE